TWVAFSVSRLLEEHLPNLVNYEFTAKMEDLLDSISRREAEAVAYLQDFYFGNGEAGLKPQLEKKIVEVDPREMGRFSLGKPETGEHRDEVFVRVGKFGPFIEQGERKGSIPNETPPDEMTLERALHLLDQAGVGEEPLGICPDTHQPVYLKQGRF